MPCADSKNSSTQSKGKRHNGDSPKSLLPPFANTNYRAITRQHSLFQHLVSPKIATNVDADRSRLHLYTQALLPISVDQVSRLPI